MDKNIEILKERKAALEKIGKETRKSLRELFDEDSFVELSAFGFLAAPDEGPADKGVVTGFGTIGGYPFYIAAQNFESDFGGLTKFGCDKIAKMLSLAEKNSTSVIWMLHSQGVLLGEGIGVLEGISSLLLKATQAKGTVPQYAIVGPKVYGAAAAIAAICDCVFFLKDSALSISSPLVLSAKSGKNLKKEEVGGFHALTHACLPAVEVKDLQEVSARIKEISELLSVPVIDAELNASAPALNEKADRAALMKLLENAVELGANSCPEVRTVLCRIGGIAVAAILMEKMRVNAENLKKIRAFSELACCYGLPLVNFVDCIGVEETLSCNDSDVLREIGEYLNILDATDTPKLAVVTGSAVGLGYSLFAAKSVGFDYTCALGSADISLFESEKGAEILLSEEKIANKEELIRKYFEKYADPIYAAQGGYLDNLVEPQFLKQYLIASLQMLLR